jgi:hypothetical protein
MISPVSRIPTLLFSDRYLASLTGAGREPSDSRRGIGSKLGGAARPVSQVFTVVGSATVPRRLPAVPGGLLGESGPSMRSR